MYWSILGDDLGESFALNDTSFVLALTRHVLIGMVQAGRFKGERLTPAQIEEAWERGLEKSLQLRCKTVDDYEQALNDFRRVLPEYVEAIDAHVTGPVPGSTCFAITSRFADKIVRLTAPERRDVMLITASITDMVVFTCKEAPKLYRLTGP